MVQAPLMVNKSPLTQLSMHKSQDLPQIPNTITNSFHEQLDLLLQEMQIIILKLHQPLDQLHLLLLRFGEIQVMVVALKQQLLPKLMPEIPN
jgi:hypothetical protein